MASLRHCRSLISNTLTCLQHPQVIIQGGGSICTSKDYYACADRDNGKAPSGWRLSVLLVHLHGRDTVKGGNLLRAHDFRDQLSRGTPCEHVRVSQWQNAVTALPSALAMPPCRQPQEIPAGGVHLVYRRAGPARLSAGQTAISLIVDSALSCCTASPASLGILQP